MAILKWLLAILAGFIVFAFAFLYATNWEPIPEAEAVSSDSPPKANSVVRVKYEKSHGSGVHIGNGYIITAAHVLDKKGKEPVVKDQFNRVRKAEIMWSNSAYDIALLRVKDYNDLSFSRIACDVPAVGEAIESWGYPLKVSQSVFRGSVSTEVTEYDDWRVAFTVDMSLNPGMSGGPAFDHKGDVIGINAGMAILGTGFSFTTVGIGYIVPGKVVCDLMGRL